MKFTELALSKQRSHYATAPWRSAGNGYKNVVLTGIISNGRIEGNARVARDRDTFHRHRCCLRLTVKPTEAAAMPAAIKISSERYLVDRLVELRRATGQNAAGKPLGRPRLSGLAGWMRRWTRRSAPREGRLRVKRASAESEIEPDPA